MRCVSADGTPSIIGLVFRLTMPTSWPALLGMPFSLRASRHEGSADMFKIRLARLYFMGHLFDPGSKYFIQLH